MLCYTCNHEMLPMIEGVLAANGFVVEKPLSKQDDHAYLTVMTNSDGGVLLFHDTVSDLAEIDIWGAAGASTGMLLERLPLTLRRRSLQRIDA